MTAASRYSGLPTLTIQSADGRQIPYLARRLLPQPGTWTATASYRVPAGQRIDVVAAITLGEAELSWRLADLNAARRPTDLQQPGQLLAIDRSAPSGGSNAV